MKWRKVKKRFKKHDLPRMMKLSFFEEESNTFLTVLNVKIKPAGGKKVDYVFRTKATDSPVYHKEDFIREPEEKPNGFSHSMSFSMNVPDSKKLKKLINRL